MQHIEEMTAGEVVALQARSGLRVRLRYTRPQQNRLADFTRLLRAGYAPHDAARCVTERAS